MLIPNINTILKTCSSFKIITGFDQSVSTDLLPEELGVVPSSTNSEQVVEVLALKKLAEVFGSRIRHEIKNYTSIIGSCIANDNLVVKNVREWLERINRIPAKAKLEDKIEYIREILVEQNKVFRYYTSNSSIMQKAISGINELMEAMKTLSVDEIKMTKVSPIVFINQILDEYSDEERKKIVLEHIDPGKNIVIDDLKIKRVIENLLNNALSAVSEVANGRVVLSFEFSDDNQVVFCIRDNGHGIAPEHMDSIFKPFFTTKKSSGGTGLGLPIALLMVYLHGGNIEVKSEVATKERNGLTEFMVKLPVETVKKVEEIKQMRFSRVRDVLSLKSYEEGDEAVRSLLRFLDMDQNFRQEGAATYRVGRSPKDDQIQLEIIESSKNGLCLSSTYANKSVRRPSMAMQYAIDSKKVTFSNRVFDVIDDIRSEIIVPLIEEGQVVALAIFVGEYKNHMPIKEIKEHFPYIIDQVKNWFVQNKYFHGEIEGRTDEFICHYLEKINMDDLLENNVTKICADMIEKMVSETLKTRKDNVVVCNRGELGMVQPVLDKSVVTIVLPFATILSQTGATRMPAKLPFFFGVTYHQVYDEAWKCMTSTSNILSYTEDAPLVSEDGLLRIYCNKKSQQSNITMVMATEALKHNGKLIHVSFGDWLEHKVGYGKHWNICRLLKLELSSNDKKANLKEELIRNDYPEQMVEDYYKYMTDDNLQRNSYKTLYEEARFILDQLMSKDESSISTFNNGVNSGILITLPKERYSEIKARNVLEQMRQEKDLADLSVRGRVELEYKGKMAVYYYVQHKSTREKLTEKELEIVTGSFFDSYAAVVNKYIDINRLVQERRVMTNDQLLLKKEDFLNLFEGFEVGNSWMTWLTFKRPGEANWVLKSLNWREAEGYEL
ncbi:MAG: HAMP domain-containing sensor histidine kinase, partial [Candidatus Margulisiibacteriota bacterium]